MAKRTDRRYRHHRLGARRGPAHRHQHRRDRPRHLALRLPRRRGAQRRRRRDAARRRTAAPDRGPRHSSWSPAGSARPTTTSRGRRRRRPSDSRWRPTRSSSRSSQPFIARHTDPRSAAQVLTQAFVLEGADVLPPTTGTAAGQVVPTPAGQLVLLPGPPREMRPMLAHLLETMLVRAGDSARARRDGPSRIRRPARRADGARRVQRHPAHRTRQAGRRPGDPARRRCGPSCLGPRRRRGRATRSVRRATATDGSTLAETVVREAHGARGHDRGRRVVHRRNDRSGDHRRAGRLGGVHRRCRDLLERREVTVARCRPGRPRALRRRSAKRSRSRWRWARWTLSGPTSPSP